jgi:hypothetical protein
MKEYHIALDQWLIVYRGYNLFSKFSRLSGNSLILLEGEWVKGTSLYDKNPVILGRKRPILFSKLIGHPLIESPCILFLQLREWPSK